LIVVAGVSLSGATAVGGAGSNIVNETLPNGLRVTIVSDPSLTTMATRVWYHIGSADEDPQHRGFAHLFEHMMFGATAKYPKEAYMQWHTSHGGSDNARTEFDQTVYESEVPPEAFPEVLELEADRMLNLALNEDNLANEKKIVTEELRLKTENSPEARLWVKVLAAVLDDHPYAHTPAGTKEDIAAASLAHSLEFYRSFYGPQNAHLVIVGPLDPQETLRAVLRTFGELAPRGQKPPEIPLVTDVPVPRDSRLKEDLPPAEVAMACYRLPPADAADHDALVVLNWLLAGGQIQPFADELVRRRHKAMEAETEFQMMRRGGAVIFSSYAVPYRREKTAFRLIDETIAHLGRRAWLTPETLAVAKRRLTKQQHWKTFYASSRADAIGQAEWWQGDWARGLDETKQVEAVTLEQVSTVFDKYIANAKPVRVYVSPEKVPGWITLFGWLYPLVSR
jgi:zinc protease